MTVREHWQSCFDVQTQRCVCPIENMAVRQRELAPDMAELIRDVCNSFGSMLSRDWSTSAAIEKRLREMVRRLDGASP